MAYAERHYIIVPASLATQANAEAVKWDRDVGGASTFGGAALSSDGGATLTHYVSSTLIDDAYVPPGQGGQNALQVLNAFYATGHYRGYRIRRPQGDKSALLEGDVEKWRPAGLDDEGVPYPAGWVMLGTGRLAGLAMADAGLVRYVEDGEPDEPTEPDAWAPGVQYYGPDDPEHEQSIVTYQGTTYECLQAHTSQPGWTPTAVPALWSEVS